VARSVGRAHPERCDRGAELEVVEVAEHDDVGLAVDAQDPRDEVMDDLGLARPLHGRGLVRELEAAVGVLVAALGVEVLGDHEDGGAPEPELAGERLATRSTGVLVAVGGVLALDRVGVGRAGGRGGLVDGRRPVADQVDRCALAGGGVRARQRPWWR
jgi:hypothetical protein